MTHRARPRRSPWRRVMATTRGRVEVVALSLTVVVCAALAVEVVPAIADADRLAGTEVRDEDVPSLVAAALSCPALTPPKLAAQLMAATGYGTEQGADGIAGLDDAAWRKWQPWDGAQRSDRQANILALGHHTCENVGRLRSQDVGGDLWAAALAADEVGVAAVVAARGVPEAAQAHVDKVTAWANWYADQPQLSAAATAAASPSSEPAVAVPAGLVADVNAAGRVCATVTPARIAAQLRALSGFDANKLDATTRAGGIAQFSDAMWERYRPRRDASVWDPDDAIPALGTAMCELTDQFAGLSGADPYVLALGAYQWGVEVIRQANGLPRANVTQLATVVQKYAPEYQKDARLTRKTAEPATTPSQTPSRQPSSSQKPSASPSPSSSLPPSPAPIELEAGTKYLIQNAWAGAVVDVPGDDVQQPSGTRVQLWASQRAKDQFWRFQKNGEGYYYIVNDFSNLRLAVEGGSVENNAKLVVETANDGSTNQQWTLSDAGNGEIFMRNRHSEKYAELLGAQVQAPDGTWNAYLVEQFDRVEPGQDQRWVLLR